MVYSANFYADRNPAHEKDFYTGDLMVRIPKKEYLFGTTSSLGPKASFGLDFGEIYKRSVIGVRVYGVPAGEKEALAAFFSRLNDDYHKRAGKTEYHDEEIKYDYLRLNCAKTIGAAFKLGAGYKDLEVKSAKILSGRQGGRGGQRERPHRDGDEAHQGVGRARLRTGRRAVQEVRRLDLRGSAREGEGRVQGPAQPVPLGPVARLPQTSRGNTRTSTISSRCTCSTTSPSTACA